MRLVEIIFIYIPVAVKLRRIYIPVSGAAGIDDSYRISGIKLSDFIGSIVRRIVSQRQIAGGYTNRFGHDRSRRGSIRDKIVAVYVTVLVILRGVYVPVGGIAGVKKLHRITGVELADLIGGIKCFLVSQRQVAGGYTDDARLFDSAGTVVEVVFVDIAIFSKLRRVHIPVSRITGIADLDGIAAVKPADLVGGIEGLCTAKSQITAADVYVSRCRP